jgi:hypothetical protein
MYIVGKKASFVHGGRLYSPKDEIDESLFDKDDLKVLIKNEKLLTQAQAKVVFADDEEPAKPDPAGGDTPPKNNGPKPLDDMNLDELKAFAAEKNIAIQGNKAEILAAIKAAEGGK